MLIIKMKLQTVNILVSYFYSIWTFTANVLLFYLTNQPQFSMVYPLIDHRNDVIKCSKLTWNHEPRASGFTAKF